MTHSTLHRCMRGALAVAVLLPASLAAQQAARHGNRSAHVLASPTSPPPGEQQDGGETDQAFAATPYLPQEEDTGTPDGSSSGDSTFQTLSGVEREGIRTQSILVSTLEGTSIASDGRPTGLLTATVAIPGQMTSRIDVPCTATLIDEDVVITAFHCYPGVISELASRGYASRSASVAFGYDTDTSIVETYSIKRVIDADKDLDFAVLELAIPEGASTPGRRFGWVNVALEAPPSQQLRMYHHPYGYYKMVLQDATCRAVSPVGALPTRIYHQCDTRGGSSGAALLGYQLVQDYGGSSRPMAYGVHISGLKTGLDNAERDFNMAVPMTAIAEKSEYVARIGCRRISLDWECPDRSLARPATVLFDLDQMDVRPQDTPVLDQIAALATPGQTSFPKYRVTGLRLIGFAERGSSETYAMSMSERRAASVRTYLEARGVPPGIISTEGRGSDGAPPGQNQQLRRVEILVDYEYFWG